MPLDLLLHFAIELLVLQSELVKLRADAGPDSRLVPLGLDAPVDHFEYFLQSRSINALEVLK